MKIICGFPDRPALAPGRYYTAINVHNPSREGVPFRRKFALTAPGEAPGTISPFTAHKLGPDQALEFDCDGLFRRFRLKFSATSYAWEFLQSPDRALPTKALGTATDLAKPWAGEPVILITPDPATGLYGSGTQNEEDFVRHQLRNYSIMTAAVAAAVTLSSCKTRDQSTAGSVGAGDSSAGMTSDTGHMASSSEGALTDANIVALLDEANVADSTAGAYAFGKATNPEVKAFAKLMMGEHHALRAQGKQLAQRLNVTPEPPANDPLKPAAQGEMTALKAAPKGPQFDRTYIEQTVGGHKTVLDLAEKAHDEAQNEELKKLIEQAKPVIEKHLDRAEEIQKKLGRPSA